MNTIRLILGLMIGGIEVAAGRRKGAVSSYTQARERIWRGGKNTTAHHRQGTRSDSCRFGPGQKRRSACRRPKCAARNKVADTPALRDEVLVLFAISAKPKQIEVALKRRALLRPDA
ncbi:MAG: hypothetical protein J6386_01765 [Candidatus Synoicihabitans palmerolidicus]|nr:hypothetical protein [Candidatus Synoicihabitans palmerolidicus]